METPKGECRTGGYLLAGGTVIAVASLYLARAPWPALAAVAVVGLGGSVALTRKRPAT